MSNGKTKQPVVRYILLNIFLFLAYYAFLLWFSGIAFRIALGWSETVIQLLICLPFGLIGYGIMKKARPVDNPRVIEKKRFRKFQLFYLLLIQIPIKCASPIFAAGAGPETHAMAAGMLHVFVIAPFIEELVYRGVFYNLARKKLGFKHAVLVNGLIFTFIHEFKPLTLANAFLVAVLYCALYEMTGTIRYGIVLHYTFNLLTFPIIFLIPLIPVFVSIPLMIIAIILHIILIIKTDKLEAKLFA